MTSTRHAFPLLAATFLLACAHGGSTPGDGGGGSAGGGGVEATFSARSCGELGCWEIPTPQGTFLRAARTTPQGTTYAVGDHGAFLRYDGKVWAAAPVPPITDSEAGSFGPNFLAVAAVADDDVWLAGSRGVLYHYDGRAITAHKPPGASGDAFVSVWAGSKTDVYVAESPGRIFHYDGKAWSTSHTGAEGLVGLWGTAADDLWALTANAAGATLLRFDGQAWSPEPVVAEPAGYDATGAVIGLSGAERGKPMVAFQYYAVRREPDGGYTPIYAPDTHSSAVYPALDFLATGPDEAWMATGDGAVLLSSANLYGTRTTDSIDALGLDGEGQPWFFGPGGRIVSHAHPTLAAPNVEPTHSALIGTINNPYVETRCAPSGADLLCLERTPGDAIQLNRYHPSDAAGTTRALVEDVTGSSFSDVRANASGSTLLISTDKLTVRTAHTLRTLPAPSGTYPIRLVDAALLDDDSLYALSESCQLYHATAAVSELSEVPLEHDYPYRGDCQLFLHDGQKLWLGGTRSIGDTWNSRVFVHAADGHLVHDFALPPEAMPRALTVTASGTPFAAASVADPAYAYYVIHYFRGDGGKLERLAIDPTVDSESYGIFLQARGEEVRIVGEQSEDGPFGVPMYRWNGSAVESARLPLHGVWGLLPGQGGTWVQTWGAFYLATW